MTQESNFGPCVRPPHHYCEKPREGSEFGARRHSGGLTRQLQPPDIGVAGVQREVTEERRRTRLLGLGVSARRVTAPLVDARAEVSAVTVVRALAKAGIVAETSQLEEY